MKVVESFIAGKALDRKCEDLIVATADFVGVLDGATDKTNVLYGGVAGGRFAAQTLGAAMKGLPADCGVSKGVELLTTALRKAIEETGEQSEDHPSASAAIYSRTRRELWRVGDVSYLIDGRGTAASKQIDVVTSDARAALLRALIARGASVEELRVNDLGRAMVLPLLEAQHEFRNSEVDSEYGFGAFDGAPIPQRFQESVIVEEGATVVLSTDGYPGLCPTLAEAEAYLERSLTRDPLRIYEDRTTKAADSDEISFDDRAYIRLQT